MPFFFKVEANSYFPVWLNIEIDPLGVMGYAIRGGFCIFVNIRLVDVALTGSFSSGNLESSKFSPSIVLILDPRLF